MRFVRFVLLIFLLNTGLVFAQAPPLVSCLNKPVAGFYSKFLNAGGIMVRSSDVVDDEALNVAAGKINMMLAKIPMARHNLAQWGAEIHIIGQYQQTSDLPEFADQKGVTFVDNLGNKTDIDRRTRGLGGIYTSCGEENLLGLPHDRYAGGQDICIHEFAHNIMYYGLGDKLREAIDKQFHKAKAAGLWKDAYAMVDAGEYWAELSMWYFGRHGEFLKGTHSPAIGFAALREYDKGGYDLLDSVYSGKASIKEIKVAPAQKAKRGSVTPLKGSARGETAFMVTNNTAKKLKLYWLDYDGVAKPHGEATAYNSFTYPTFRGHIWEVRNMKGKLIGRYRMNKAYVRAVIN